MFILQNICGNNTVDHKISYAQKWWILVQKVQNGELGKKGKNLGHTYTQILGKFYNFQKAGHPAGYRSKAQPPSIDGD